jgi:hypothetical protein
MNRVKRAAVALIAGAGLTGGALAMTAGTASADYGPGAVYQVEISVNPQGFGEWFWAALYPTTSATSGTGDYQQTDCIHLGGGHFVGGEARDAAAHSAGDLSWSIANGVLTMTGIGAIGGIDPQTIQVPVPPGGYGHGNTVMLSDAFGAFTGTFTGRIAQVQLAP